MVHDIVYLGDKAAIVVDVGDLFPLFYLLGHQLTGPKLPVLQGGYGLLRDGLVEGKFFEGPRTLRLAAASDSSHWQLVENS